MKRVETGFELSEWEFLVLTQKHVNFKVAKGLEAALLFHSPEQLTKAADNKPSGSLTDVITFEYATRVQQDFWSSSRAFSACFGAGSTTQVPLSKLAASFVANGNRGTYGRTNITEERISPEDVQADPNLIEDGGNTSLGRYLTVFPDVKMWAYILCNLNVFSVVTNAKHADLVTDLNARITKVVGGGYTATGLTLDEVKTFIDRLTPNYRDEPIVRGIALSLRVASIGQLATTTATLGAENLPMLSDVLAWTDAIHSESVKKWTLHGLTQLAKTGATYVRNKATCASSATFCPSILVSSDKYYNTSEVMIVGPVSVTPNYALLPMSYVTMKYDWVAGNEDAFSQLGMTPCVGHRRIDRTRGNVWNLLRGKKT